MENEVLLIMAMNSLNRLEHIAREVELKVEHRGTNVVFLDLGISFKDSIYIYNLLEKTDKFSFFIVRMPHLTSIIPNPIFYGLFYSELFRIAKCTELISEIYNRMAFQGSNIRQLQNCWKDVPMVS